jgi:hypothetical protein
MHCLSDIARANRNAVERARRGAAESETSRHCSYAGDSAEGVVLHSAKQRSTVFLPPSKAKIFLALWLGTNSQAKHDLLVESYF